MNEALYDVSLAPSPFSDCAPPQKCPRSKSRGLHTSVENNIHIALARLRIDDKAVLVRGVMLYSAYGSKTTQSGFISRNYMEHHSA